MRRRERRSVSLDDPTQLEMPGFDPASTQNDTSRRKRAQEEQDVDTRPPRRLTVHSSAIRKDRGLLGGWEGVVATRTPKRTWYRPNEPTVKPSFDSLVRDAEKKLKEDED